MKQTAFLLLFLLSQSATFGHSPEGDSERKFLFLKRKDFSLAVASSIFVTTLMDSYYAWWKDNFRPFSFSTPPKERGWFNEPRSLGIDKIGHFYSSYFFYRTKKNVLLWGGYDERSATWISSAFTGAFALLIEVGDGFSTFGFDYQDLVFNLGGLGYGILQDQIAFLRNFQVKWSYFPPEGFDLPPRFSEHYDGHIYWLAFDLHNLLKRPLGSHWPDFVRPAVGFSVADGGTRREFVIGLDFNLDFLFDRNNENWELVRNTVQMIHTPAQGAKYSPGSKLEYRFLLLN